MNHLDCKVRQFTDDTTVNMPVSVGASFKLYRDSRYSGLHFNMDKSIVLSTGKDSSQPPVLDNLQCGERAKILAV